jgi:hypothetical protein
LLATIFKAFSASDKGKPVVKQGRKAVSLLVFTEIVWLPKAIRFITPVQM